MRIEPSKRLIKYDVDPDATTVDTGDFTVTAGDVVVTAGSVVQTVPNEAHTDPGASGTITLASGAVHNICVIVTATGESRTMGVPEFVGQECIIHLGTDGGDLTLTNVSGWKGGGSSDDVATFDTVEDLMVIKACGLDAVDWRWIADVGVAFG